jgi:hypothetical protein
MKRLLILSLLVSLMVSVGCQGGSSVSSANPVDKPGDKPGSKPQVQGTEPSGSTGAKPGVTLPEELKTDAYHWMGLGYGKPIRYQYTDHTGAAYTGDQSIVLDSVTNGKALYKVTRTDSLKDHLGDEDWSLEKDGVFIIGNSQMGSGFRDKQAASTLTPGASWTSATKIDYNGSTLEQNLKLAVVGMKHVKTKAGEQDALLVTAKGTLKNKGTTSRVEASAWYVKDKGMVKNVLTLTTGKPKEPPAVITIEETK